MKCVKIPLSILLVLIITLIPVTSRAADSFSYSNQAQTLHDLGLYQGIDQDTFEPDLGAALNRETGVVMLLRVFGLEDAALALSDDEADAALSGFADAGEVSGWAKRQLAYAVQNGLVVGNPDGTLAPHAPMAGRAYCSLILRQLGYAPDYNNAVAELADNGGLTEAQALQFSSANLIRDDLVGITYGALSARDPEGRTVIGQLVETGAIDEGQASSLGLSVPAPPAPVIPLAPKPVVPAPRVYVPSSGHHHDSTPNISIIGLQDTQVPLGYNSLPFSVSPSDAVLSAISSDQEAELFIKDNSNDYSLEFTPTQIGNFTVTVTATRSGYKSATQTINITVYAASTVKPGQENQTGIATPAANGGNPAAVKYTTHDVSTWFEAAEAEDILWYYLVSATDQDLIDVGPDVDYWPDLGWIEYTPAAEQASKTVTIAVKAKDSKTKRDSKSNVTITVTVGAVPADAVACPALANGLSFADDNATDTDTIITLGALSENSNTFVYKISDDENAVPTPNVGEDLSTWAEVENSTHITAANGKHIGVAEVNGSQAVQFSDAVAITEAEPVIGTLTVEAVDDNTNDTNTIVSVTPAVSAEYTRLYKNFGSDEATLPTLDTVLKAGENGWSAFPEDGSIAAVNGDKIVVVDTLTTDNEAKFVGQTAAVAEA